MNHGIGVKQKRCYRRTTKANDNHPVATNLLDRDFSAVTYNNGMDNCYDNALTESILGNLKMEWVHHAFYETCAHARADIFLHWSALSIADDSIQLWEMSVRLLLKRLIIQMPRLSLIECPQKLG